MYEQTYELARILNLDPKIIPSPNIGNLDGPQFYSAMLDRGAQSLNGQPSPLSSKSPNTAHARMFEIFAYALEMIGEELKVKSDWDWVQHFRLLGLSVSPADYPIINLVFERDQGSRMAGVEIEIPYPIEVRSRLTPGLAALTTTDAVMKVGENTCVIPARLNQLGAIPQIQEREFTDAPPISYVENVYNLAPPECVVYEGRNVETLAQAMLRLRQSLKHQNRCVVIRDYQETALEFGAWKANAIKGMKFSVSGDSVKTYLADFVTVAVYPSSTVNILSPFFEDRATSDRYEILPAQIIPVDGTLRVKVQPHIGQTQGIDLVRDTLVDYINPPLGYNSQPEGWRSSWGDLKFESTVAETLKDAPGIISVPSLSLKHAFTGQPLSEVPVTLLHLFEIQDTIEIEIVY